MPPRKSDAALRKSNAGAEAAPAAAAAEQDQTMAVDASQADDTQVDDAQADDAQLADDADKADTEAADKDAAPASAKDKEQRKAKSHHSDAITIEDLNMPRSIVTRLAKSVLPPTTQLQGSAITAMTKSAPVFISHLANAANVLTTNAGKKTIMPADVFAALDDIEFGFMREQLEAEFAKFNQIQTSKRTDYRKRVAAAKKGADDDEEGGAGDNAKGDGEGEGEGEAGAGADKDRPASPASPASAARDAPPQAKKLKRAHGDKAIDESAVGREEGEPGEADEDEEEEHGAEHEEEHEGGEDDEEDEDEDDDAEEEEEEEEEEEGDEVDDEGEDGPDDDDDEALDSDGSE